MDETEPRGTSAIQKFAMSFRNYSIALGVIVSAIPFATSRIDLLPMFDGQRDVLTFFTSLLSLLGVAFLFGVRRRIGAAVFPPDGRRLSKSAMSRRLWYGVRMPGALVVLSLVALLTYLASMAFSVERAALRMAIDPVNGRTLEEMVAGPGEVEVSAQLFGQPEPSATVIARAWDVKDELGEITKRRTTVRFQSEEGIQLLRRKTPSMEVPLHWVTEIAYVLMFGGAALAFVWFGLVEHLQSQLGLSDRELLERPYVLAPDHVFRIAEVKDLDESPAPVHFEMRYDPEKTPPALVSGPHGPICSADGNVLTYLGGEADRHRWACTTIDYSSKEKKTITLHEVTLPFDDIGVRERAVRAARAELEALVKK